MRLTSLWSSRLGVGLIGTVLAAGAAGDSAAGVVIVSQELDIVASGPGPESRITSTNPFFQDAASSTDEGEGFSNRTLLSLEAAAGESGILYRGNFDFSVEDTRTTSDPEQAVLVDPEGTASARTVFSVDRPSSYTLRYDLRRTTEDEGLSILTDGEARFFGDNDPSDSLLSSGEVRTGVLQPGEYSISFARRVEGFASPPVSADFTESFDLTLDLVVLGDNGGGGEPNPIPLPPAAWSGLVILGAGALNRLRKRRTV